MTDESRKEMLSAYLDDELSPDARAQVEQWLLDSAELRQLFSELRSVRNDVQSLPRHELSEDLGPAVLRRAERAVLSGKGSPASRGSITPGSARSSWWARAGSKRMFIWPAVAVAAALVVALFDVGGDKREVAQQAPRQEGPAEQAGETRRGTIVESGEDAPAVEETHAKRALSVAPSAKVGRSPAPPAGAPAERAAGARPADADRRDLNEIRDSSVADEAPAMAPPDAPVKSVGELREYKFAESLKMETSVRRALENREQLNFIQCDVSPEFILDNQMEKVLEDNRAKFVRLAEPGSAKAQGPAAGAKLELKSAPPVELRYTVEVTPVQVEKIVTELDQERGRNRVANMILGLHEPVPLADQKVPGAAPAQQEATANYYFNKRQPVTIYLRQMLAPEAAAATPAVRAAEP